MLDSGWGQAPSAPGANRMVRTPASYASTAIRCPHIYVGPYKCVSGAKKAHWKSDYYLLFLSQ